MPGGLVDDSPVRQQTGDIAEGTPCRDKHVGIDEFAQRFKNVRIKVQTAAFRKIGKIVGLPL